MYAAHNSAADSVCQSGRVDSFCDTEVCDFRCTVSRQHYIVRFYVSVNQLIFMGYGKRRSDLFCQLDDTSVWKRSFFTDQFIESISLNQFHNYVVDISFLTYIENIYDIRMRQACCSLGLPSETFDEFSVSDVFRF